MAADYGLLRLTGGHNLPDCKQREIIRMKFNLGQRLFPKLPPDLQRRRMGVIYLTALVCLVIGFFVLLVMEKMSGVGGH